MSAVTAIRGRHQVVNKVVVNVALLLLAAGFFVPLLWLVLAAFDARAGAAVAWPHPWTSTNFKAILTWDTTYRPMLNGAILCGGGTVVCVLASVLAAYPLSRYQFRAKRPFLLTILFATGLPITAIMVPVYGLFVQVNLIDTLSGTILFMATTALPISIWLTKNFMDGVPIELEEAAWTDGAGAMQGLRTIVLPLMWPGLAVVTIYTFIGLWGNFFVPFVLLSSNDRLPASVSIYTFFGQYGQIVYGQLAAYSILYSLPAVLLYLLLSRRLGGAFSFSGAVKG
jgi:multiple sugar transport system permease protein